MRTTQEIVAELNQMVKDGLLQEVIVNGERRLAITERGREAIAASRNKNPEL